MHENHENQFWQSEVKQQNDLQAQFVMGPIAMTFFLTLKLVIWIINKIVFLVNVHEYHKNIEKNKPPVPACFNDGRHKVTDDGKLVEIDA